MEPLQGHDFVSHRRYLYLKSAGLLAGAALLAYVLGGGSRGTPFGATIAGYAMGVVAALLILLLAWYGIRKRHAPACLERRRSRSRAVDAAAGNGAAKKPAAERRRRDARHSWRYGWTLRGWLSSHAYLGASLLVLTTLHAGFRFGANVHTLCYALTLLTITSGIYGVVAYLKYPRLITRNLGDEALDGVLQRIAELDETARQQALGLPDEVNAVVEQSRLGTRIGGTLLQQISGRQRGCPTDLAIEASRAFGARFVRGEQPKALLELYAVLLQKQKLVRQARREVALNARMQAWLYLHAPLSIALLAALVAHVVAVHVYW